MVTGQPGLAPGAQDFCGGAKAAAVNSRLSVSKAGSRLSGTAVRSEESLIGSQGRGKRQTGA